jgi:hypothetical protein
MIWVTESQPRPDFRVWVRFSDGSEGEVDLRDTIFSDHRPIAVALRDASAFAALRVDSDTVTWANGFDLAPEFLLDKLRSAGADARSKAGLKLP